MLMCYLQWILAHLFSPLGIQSVSSGYHWAWFLRRRVSQPSQRSSLICAASRAPPAWFDGQFQFWHFRPQGFSQSCPFQHAATRHHSMAELGSHAWLGGLTATAEGSGTFKWEMAPNASSWMLCNRLNKCFKQIVWVVFTWLKLDQLPWKPRLDPGIHVMFSWNGAPVTWVKMFFGSNQYHKNMCTVCKYVCIYIYNMYVCIYICTVAD